MLAVLIAIFKKPPFLNHFYFSGATSQNQRPFVNVPRISIAHANMDKRRRNRFSQNVSSTTRAKKARNCTAPDRGALPTHLSSDAFITLVIRPKKHSLSPDSKQRASRPQNGAGVE
jgi:hypothetical protein